MKNILIASIVLILASCGFGDTLELPPVRPEGTINGYVIDNVIVNAQVSIYGFIDGKPDVLLGVTQSDESGYFSVNVRAADQQVLIESRGGSYREEATDTIINIREDQVLTTITSYKSGEVMDTLVTPLTHMGSAVALYNSTQGDTLDQAVSGARETMENIVGLDVYKVIPHMLSNPEHAGKPLDENILYGFYLAGFSSWSSWINTENDLPQHNIYTSAGVSQVLYADLLFDGLLNGIGAHPQTNEPISLSLGYVDVDHSQFRRALSTHMLAMARHNANLTAVSYMDLIEPARSIAEKEVSIFGGGVPESVLEEAPIIEAALEDDQYFGGQFAISADVSSILGAEQMQFLLDGEEILNADSNNPSISIDSTKLDEGAHQIEIIAEDLLGNRGTRIFTINIDNTQPTGNVNPVELSNQTSMIITGTYNDTGAGVKSILTQGQPANLHADKSWDATVNLLGGTNIIDILILDYAGNEYAFTTQIDMDNALPIFNSAGHSMAKLSNGDSTYYSEQLTENNVTTPLYFESDNVSLNGVTPSTLNLTSLGIPYYRFSVDDPESEGIATPRELLQVSAQYMKNDVVEMPWHTLQPEDDIYILPLVSEFLSASWYLSTPEDTHTVLMKVTDLAGNINTIELRFRADIFVPHFSITEVNDLSDDLFSNLPFEDRQQTNSMEFPSTAYSFRNTSGKSFLISMTDDSTHNTEQVIEQLVREHQVHKKTTYDWRGKFVSNLFSLTDECPQAGPWQNIDFIFNYRDGSWIRKNKPGARFDNAFPIFEDALPVIDISESSWQRTADFDSQHNHYDNRFGLTKYKFIFDYDYAMNPSDQHPLLVSNWQRLNITDKNDTKSCPNLRNFEEKEFYIYESVSGYPKNTVSSFVETVPFSTTSYVVHDTNTSEYITPYNGWFRVPADHSVIINKIVTTPDLKLYDQSLPDPDTYTSYSPTRADKSITWIVDRHLGIDVIHDVGDAASLIMSPRPLSSGSGLKSYTIGR